MNSAQTLDWNRATSGRPWIISSRPSLSLLAYFMHFPMNPAVLTALETPPASAPISLKALNNGLLKGKVRRQPWRTITEGLTWTRSVWIARSPSYQRFRLLIGRTWHRMPRQRFPKTLRITPVTCGSMLSTMFTSQKRRCQITTGPSSFPTYSVTSSFVYSTTMTHRSRSICECKRKTQTY